MIVSNEQLGQLGSHYNNSAKEHGQPIKIKVRFQFPVNVFAT